MKRLLLSGTTAMVLILGCQPQAPAFSDVERAAVEAEIAAARDAFFDAATTLDADALVAYWDQDFIHLSNSDIAPVTKEMLAEAWQPLSHIELDITSDYVRALSKDAGYTIRLASYVVYDTAGAVVESNDWAGTHIWVRTDEGWKVQSVHEGRPIQN
jgi:hypothetical protein